MVGFAAEALLSVNSVATIMDVSREAGVSSATVSRVLTGSAEADPATKKLALAAVKKLDCRPNLVARGLRRRSSQVIALIVTDIENHFYTSRRPGSGDLGQLP
jgi:LacI family transcriptional regulator